MEYVPKEDVIVAIMDITKLSRGNVSKILSNIVDSHDSAVIRVAELDAQIASLNNDKLLAEESVSDFKESISSTMDEIELPIDQTAPISDVVL